MEVVEVLKVGTGPMVIERWVDNVIEGLIRRNEVHDNF